MSLTITHPFVSLIADAGDATLVQPSDWNDDHSVVGDSSATSGYVLVAQGSGIAPIWSSSFPGIITFPDGAVGAPGIAFTNQTTTGFYRIGSANVGLSLAGTKIVDFSATITAFTGNINSTGTIEATTSFILNGVTILNRGSPSADYHGIVNQSQSVSVGRNADPRIIYTAGGNVLMNTGGSFIVNNNNGTVNYFMVGATGITQPIDRGLRSTNQTSAAGAAAGTLGNSPAAGDPGFWLKITVNGTNYAVPCWAG